MCSQREAIHFLSFPRAGTRVCEIELCHMGKNNRNPDMVCEKITILMYLFSELI